MSTDEPLKYCSNCKKSDIPSQNFAMHEAFCKRNIVVCDLCDKPVHSSEIEEHQSNSHAKDTCSQCKLAVERRFLEQHNAEECPVREQVCSFCDIGYPACDLSEHSKQCGSRTDNCSNCSCRVRLCDMAAHVERCLHPPQILLQQRRYCHHPELHLQLPHIRSTAGASLGGAAIAVDYPFRVGADWASLDSGSGVEGVADMMSRARLTRAWPSEPPPLVQHSMDEMATRRPGATAVASPKPMLVRPIPLARPQASCSGISASAQLAFAPAERAATASLSSPTFELPPPQAVCAAQQQADLTRPTRQADMQAGVKLDTAKPFNDLRPGREEPGKVKKSQAQLGSSWPSHRQSACMPEVSGSSMDPVNIRRTTADQLGVRNATERYVQSGAAASGAVWSGAASSADLDCDSSDDGDAIKCERCGELFPADVLKDHQAFCGVCDEDGNHILASAFHRQDSLLRSTRDILALSDSELACANSGYYELNDDEPLDGGDANRLGASLEAMLPCQFCDRLFPTSKFNVHQALCNGEENGYASGPLPQFTTFSQLNSCGPVAANYDNSEYRDGEIQDRGDMDSLDVPSETMLPCQFCERPFSASEFNVHQALCDGRDSLLRPIMSRQPNSAGRGMQDFSGQVERLCMHCGCRVPADGDHDAVCSSQN